MRVRATGNLDHLVGFDEMDGNRLSTVLAGDLCLFSPELLPTQLDDALKQLIEFLSS
jgi:hypothetical protein